MSADIAGIACLAGIAPWKRRRLRAMLAADRLPPVARNATQAVRLALSRGGAIASWESRKPEGLDELAAEAGVSVWSVEDGFIRSAGLGAALVQPSSLALDSQRPHYDSSGPSDLEDLLATRHFSTAECDRAKALIVRLRAGAVTKYNLGGTDPDIPVDHPVILVLGQVDDDLSVLRGGGGTMVGEMLAAVRRENPDACIVFKPHPDVASGLRGGLVDPPEADLVLPDAALTALFDRVDEVHVLTSLGGFEALLRGCRVVVHGQPFYAGWGLTEDRNAPVRRTRKLSLPELVAGALIEYPLYFHPERQRRCTVEELLDWLARAGPARPAIGPRLWLAAGMSKLGQYLRNRQGWAMDGVNSARRRFFRGRRSMSQAMHQIYDIWRIIDRPSSDVEAEIRALTQVAYLGNEEALCRVLGRYKMYVDTRDIGIASHLMLEGFWELWVTKAMMRSIRRGSVVADIGANQGYFTLLMADLTGPQGRVLSFEPNPAMARLVRKSVEVNGFGHFVDFHEIGLGAHSGRAVMDASTHQPGGGRTVESKRGDVLIKRLDKIAHARDIEFIKMDVEGFEPMVWQGMTQLLARQKQLTVFMEFTVGRLVDPAGFLDQILSHGFSLEIIREREGIVPISREELLNGPQWVDHMLVFRRAATPRPRRRQ